MDFEYIKHIQGSPYINEGRWDQFKAKAAQQMGAIGAMAGHQIQNPNETKLRSLWESFIGTLKKTLTDWQNQVSPMMDSSVQLDENAMEVKDALDELARVMLPMDPQKIGTFPETPSQYAGGRNQRDNPETYVKGSQYNRSTTSPSKLKNLAPKQPVSEGFWDAANRDLGLNKALGSNDPATILDAYKNRVITMFNTFLKDAVKMTQLPKQQIYQLLAKMQPAKSGWQAAGNMQKVVKQLLRLQSIGDLKTKAPAGAIPPVMPGGNGAPNNNGQYTGPVPPVIPPNGNGTQPPPIPPQAQKNGPVGPGIDAGTGQIPTNLLPYIILKAIDIIIDAVKSDTSHIGNYFSVAQLPTDYSQMHTLTKGPSKKTVAESDESEAYHPPKEDNGEAQPEEPETKEYPGEFVYNFHSKYHKFPGKNFSIQVKPVHEKPELEGTDIKVQVWWNGEAKKNKIFVVTEQGGKKSKPFLLMQFFDNQVSSGAGATNPQSSNFFSVDKMLKNADPTGPDKMQSVPSEIKEQIKAKENELLRALMLVTGRKSKEFKQKSDKIFPITWDDKGDVIYQGEQGPSKVSKQDLTNILKGEYNEAQKWKDTLAYHGYFDQFPEEKPKEISDYPAFAEAHTKLLQAGYEEAETLKLLSKAWMELSKSVPQDKITADELYDMSTGGGETPASVMDKYPAMKDASLALKQLGVKGYGEKLLQAWDAFTKVKSPESITADELTKAVVSGKLPQASAPKPTATAAAPATPSTPVSKPAGGAPPEANPTAPVSAPASGPAPTTNPTAPVSSAKPEPEKAEQPAKPAAKPEADSPDKHGKVGLKRKQIEWEHPKTHEIHLVSADEIEKFAKKQPKFVAALKANPEIYAKFKKLNEPGSEEGGQKKGGEKPPVKEHVEIINPFNRDNLLM